jgi:DNA topoisomerase-1
VPKSARQYKAKGEHAQEGHECIRPSHLEDSYAEQRREHLANAVSAVGSMAEAVFDLIWKRFVACQMADKLYDATTAHLGYGAGEGALIFKASGNVTTFDGWEKAYAEDESEEEGDDDSAALPPLAKGDRATTERCEATSKKTTPPSAYTEATLIQELEKLNIGRPSTFATIFATLRKRNYIETGTKGKRKNVLSSTPLGRRAVDALVASFPQEMDYKYTSRMEDSLDEIASGKLGFKSFMDAFWADLKSHFSGVDFSGNGGSGGRVFEKVVVLEKCPKCEKHPVLLHDIPAKGGQKAKLFAACEDRKCGTYIGLDRNKKAVIRDTPCPDCGKKAVTSSLRGDKCAACGKEFGGGERPVLFPECPKCKKHPIYLVKTADDTFAACGDRECKTYIGLDRADKPVILPQPCEKCGQKWVTPGKFGDRCAACGASKDKVLFEKCPRCEKAPIVLVDRPGRAPFAVCQNGACKTYIGLKGKTPIIKNANCPRCQKKWVTTGKFGDYCAACGHRME